MKLISCKNATKSLTKAAGQKSTADVYGYRFANGADSNEYIGRGVPMGWIGLYTEKKFRSVCDKIDRLDLKSNHIEKSDNSRGIQPRTGLQKYRRSSHKIRKKQFLKKLVLKIINVISIFTISPVRGCIPLELSFFFICSALRHELSSLSRWI